MVKASFEENGAYKKANVAFFFSVYRPFYLGLPFPLASIVALQPSGDQRGLNYSLNTTICQLPTTLTKVENQRWHTISFCDMMILLKEALHPWQPLAGDPDKNDMFPIALCPDRRRRIKGTKLDQLTGCHFEGLAFTCNFPTDSGSALPSGWPITTLEICAVQRRVRRR